MSFTTKKRFFTAISLFLILIMVSSYLPQAIFAQGVDVEAHEINDYFNETEDAEADEMEVYEIEVHEMEVYEIEVHEIEAHEASMEIEPFTTGTLVGRALRFPAVPTKLGRTVWV